MQRWFEYEFQTKILTYQTIAKMNRFWDFPAGVPQIERLK